jgi:hypothetical protein
MTFVGCPILHFEVDDERDVEDRYTDACAYDDGHVGREGERGEKMKSERVKRKRQVQNEK